MRRILFLMLISSFLKTTGQELQFQNIMIPDIPRGSRGVSVADLDSNGLNDIVVANQVDSLQLLGNTIYFNHREGYKRVAIANNKVNAWSESVHTVDVDNDYDLDIFFTTQFGVPNLLYLNDGQGRFAPAEAGDLTTDLTNSPGACWCDMDLDGDLDVFVVNRDGADDQLYINDGQGKLTRSKTGPWIGKGGDGRSCAWGDLNKDGTPDLYVANFVVKDNAKIVRKHKNYLYLSSPNGSLIAQKTGVLVEEENASYGVSFVDYDYDGDLDIYVTNVSISDVNALYDNLGNGVFKRSPQSVVSYEIFRPSKGQTWGDFNNDGWLDLYVANGTEGYPEIQNYLFLGMADHRFKRVYNALPAIEGHISGGTASGDFDNDGDLDIYVCNWGSDAERDDCYLNEHKGSNWVKLQLQGTTSNSYGLGSWVKLTLDNGTIQTRYFSRETGYGSENAPEIHFGIGTANKINNIEILWPTGRKQSASDLSPNAVYRILEGKDFKRIGK